MTDSTATLARDRVDIRLREHETSDPLSLSSAAFQTLQREINADATRLEVIYNNGNTVRLKATSYVGIVSLSDGPTVEIRPKVPDINIVHLLRYARGVEATTISEEASVEAGSSFVEAIATLYAAELQSAISNGLQKEYRRTSGSERYLRGKLQTQQQLQRNQGLATSFACTYEELTADTILNQGILYATTLLAQLVRDRGLQATLIRLEQRLRRKVTLTPVRASDLRDIELTRLTSHYSDLLRLTELVLRNMYIRDLQSGNQSSYSLLVDMNPLFESVVERAVESAVENSSQLHLRTQVSSQNLAEDGPRELTIRPDLLLQKSNGAPFLVGDAKWKIDEHQKRQPSNEDIYQLIAYQIAHDVPGILIYPKHAQNLESTYNIKALQELEIIEIPISSSNRSYEKFRKTLRDHLTNKLQSFHPSLE